MTAEDFFKEKYGSNDRISTSNAILLSIEFAKYHVEQALKEAKEEPKQETELDAYYGNGIGSVSKEMLQEIENQVKLTQSRGEKIVKYLEIFKGQAIYNDIALAIEFGYQLRLKEEKDEQ